MYTEVAIAVATMVHRELGVLGRLCYVCPRFARLICDGVVLVRYWDGLITIEDLRRSSYREHNVAADSPDAAETAAKIVRRLLLEHLALRLGQVAAVLCFGVLCVLLRRY